MQQFTTAAHTAIIFTMEPVFAATVAYFWGQELLTWQQATGCLFILAGMLLTEFKMPPVAQATGTLKEVHSPDQQSLRK